MFSKKQKQKQNKTKNKRYLHRIYPLMPNIKK